MNEGFELTLHKSCCRCKAALDERVDQLMGACEDCITLAESDPDLILEEFSRGAW